MDLSAARSLEAKLDALVNLSPEEASALSEAMLATEPEVEGFGAGDEARALMVKIQAEAQQLFNQLNLQSQVDSATQKRTTTTNAATSNPKA